MATVIRPELSEKNKYWVEKHRHYELKHFCLQYPFWKKSYLDADGFGRSETDQVYSRLNTPSDPTYKCVDIRTAYLDRMKLVEKTAIDADPSLASYILKAVTENLSYNQLKTRFGIPCGKDMYYDRYRRFFWLLNDSRK